MSPLTITTIQTDLRWEDKEANLRLLEEKILSLTAPAELVVLPEMFSTGFSMKPEFFAETMDGPTVSWMKTLAARKRIILTGSIIIREGNDYFNRLIWMQPNGVCGCYDKRHRFAYAGEDQSYTAGRKRLVASVKGWKVLPLVCYDLRFPVWSRQTPPEQDAGQTADATDLEYDLLLYIANWPQRRSHAWKTLLQARAIENQCYVAGVNRIGDDGNKIFHGGDTMIVDPLGEVLYHAADREEAYSLTIQKETLTGVRQHFPFWRDADYYSIAP
ncbi:MAG TPA: nitrilase family protein [Puia sp.]|jgi:omega-amidase|nr:nitrilase family protein [Puia sp.]